MSLTEGNTKMENTPRILVHPTAGGMWLTPDTPAGRELVERVPPRRSLILPNAQWRPSWGLVWEIGMALVVFTGAFFVVGVMSGRPGMFVLAGMGGVVLGYGTWEIHRARRDWEVMRASGIAVPVPREWLNSEQGRRLDRSGKVSRAELVSLPLVEGVPALVWAWKAGQQHSSVAMERLPN